MFKRLISRTSAAPAEKAQSSKAVYTFSENDKLVAQKCAEDALRLFTESLNIANQSKNLATRKSRLQVAHDKLIELKKMEKQFPFLHLENLKAVEASIANVETETLELIAAQSKPKIITTIQESQNNTIDDWKNNQDIISGLEFNATLQLRTPLRVLLRHGEIHNDINTEPPEIVKEMWEGIWLPKLKTLREITGLNIPEMPQGKHASPIGPILPSDFLPFLIAIRKIVELDEPIENRIKKLREMNLLDKWKIFVSQMGPSHISQKTGIEWIIDYFFPPFITTIPQISDSIKESLSQLGLNTANSIESASDDTLLRIKGIGKTKLKTIRDYCSGIKDNRDSDRIEDVVR